MKRLTILLLLVTFSRCTFCQDTIDVVEKNIKINGLSKQTEYYGFAEGDKVIYNVTVEKGKDLKDITVSEYAGSVRFADHTTSKVENKVFNILRNSIYVFEYNNTNISGRAITVKIQRIPASGGKKFFNTNIKWVNVVDTTYTATQKTYLLNSDTSVVEVADAKARVHSQTNLSNANKTVVDFTLPANTIRWTYWIGVGNEGQQAFQKDQADILKSGIKILGSIDPLAGLAFGLITMTHASVGNHVKYWFMPSWGDVQKFNAGQQFMQFKAGDVVTDFGLMNYQNMANTKYYVALMNDNLTLGIDVNVKILAVVVNNKYNTVVEKVPTYSNRMVPVSED